MAAAAGEIYDLIVVGGGVHGICATLHAARAGVRVLLVERDDFASQTSANSLQILHGGFRYLQNLDLGRVRESARARAWWMEHFSDLTEPLECVLPLDGRGIRRPEVFRLALALHHLQDGGAETKLPRGRVDPASRRPKIAALLPEAPRHFATWFDGLFPRPGRLAVELLRWAVHCGARALSHVEAREVLVRTSTAGRSEVAGVHVFDHESGREVDLQASRVLNFAGPWHRWTLGDNVDSLHPPSVAFNLLFRGQLPGGAALAVRARDGKNLFLWERDGCIHAGTRHLPWLGAVDRPRVESDRIDELIEDLRGALPGLRLGKRDLLAVQVGFLPAHTSGESEMAHRDKLHDHGAHGGPDGLVSVSGVKYTTAPIVAERALRQVFRSALPIRENARARPIPAAGGTHPTQSVPTIAEIVRSLDESRETVEVVRRLIEDEMVSHLDELLLGRLDGITLGPGLRTFARRLVSCLGWDRDRTTAELDRLESRLRPLLASEVG